MFNSYISSTYNIVDNFYDSKSLTTILIPSILDTLPINKYKVIVWIVNVKYLNIWVTKTLIRNYLKSLKC